MRILTNLPSPGADNNTWGDELNAALVELDTNAALANEVYTKTAADSKFLQTVNGKAPTAGNVDITAADVGATPTGTSYTASESDARYIQSVNGKMPSGGGVNLTGADLGLAPVATSGSYNDLTDKPAGGTGGSAAKTNGTALPAIPAPAPSVLCEGGVWQGPRPPVAASVTWIKLASTDPEPAGALPGDTVLTPPAETPSTEKLLRHDGDTGQPDETAVSAINSASPLNNKFDTVVVSSGASLVYDTAHALPLRGECFRASSGATAGSAFVQWGGDPALGVSLASWGSTILWRGYYWFDALPNAAFNIVALQAFAGGTIRARLRLRTDGKIALQGSTSTELVTTTNPVPLGQWVRIEAKFVLSSTGVGTIDVGFYVGEASTNNAGDNASATAVNNGADTIDQVRNGIAVSVTGENAFWFGGLALSDTTQPRAISSDVFDNGIRTSTSSVVVGPVLLPGASSTTTLPVNTRPTVTDSAFITAAEAATLPKTGSAFNSVAAMAADMRAGALTPNMDSVDNRVGSTALSCAIYWLATGKSDTALLSALKTYILAAPGTSLPTTQALNPMRALGSLLMAVDIIKSNGGGWDGSATLPNKGGITFDAWLSNLETTVLGTGNTRWQTILGIASDSANNWGSVARYALVAIARVRGDATLMSTAVNLVRRYLGDTSVAAAFNATSDYLSSWDNTSGLDSKVNAGIGFVDDLNPGLDGVVIDDVNRGATGYSPAASYYGAVGSGLTYPLEAAEYVWATTVVLHHLGYDVLDWSASAVLRMGDWFARAGVFEYGEATFTIYLSHRWYASRLRGGSAPYGTPKATNTTIPRALPVGDWLCDPTSEWMRKP